MGVLGGLILSFAAGGFDAALAADKLKVVATFSILGDLSQRVAGDHATIISLVGPDGDAHVFEPGPRESAALAGADVLVANGLGFEPWLERLSEAAGFKGTLVVATDGVTPLPASHEEEAGTEAAGEEAGDDHDHGAFDPHAFQDLANGQIYVANIAKGLSAADPAHAADFQANARRLAADMAALDASLKAEFASIPAEDRRILTSHDAFAYFSRAYGIDFVSIHGFSTEAEPSAQDLARIIEQSRDGKIKAIFLENMADPRLAETVAGESGVRIGGRLYADALSPENGPAPDYLSLFRYNAKQLLEALR
ncbi:MAG TPA: metal ABC transporter substrate-binding protein [Alphaproteobacteria bacterium]|nr:metal ABC transporter substrate-binding protein [Alphaproteobacteria bacterium]